VVCQRRAASNWGRGGTTMVADGGFLASKIHDPIIRAIATELGGLQPTTVYDAKSQLHIVPYKSVASNLAKTKLTCQAYLESQVDPRQEKLKNDLQVRRLLPTIYRRRILEARNALDATLRCSAGAASRFGGEADRVGTSTRA
jgi:hypothetical protein